MSREQDAEATSQDVVTVDCEQDVLIQYAATQVAKGQVIQRWII